MSALRQALLYFPPIFSEPDLPVDPPVLPLPPSSPPPPDALPPKGIFCRCRFEPENPICWRKRRMRGRSLRRQIRPCPPTRRPIGARQAHAAGLRISTGNGGGGDDGGGGAGPPPQTLSPSLPPDWDTMEFGALCALLNNPARLSREGRAANSTFNAVLYALRKGGNAALAEQAARLQECSDRQIEDLVRHLKKAGVDEQLLHALVELLP